MIYEVLKYVQQNGSINASQIVELLEPFDDMNSRAEVLKCKKSDYSKYCNWGLEAMKETIAKHQKNKYQLR